uniref:Uncharacterized protein n=1 Tax=Cacopsylla melanoneura TaxID=428564 RepID=A0A8D8Y296_9HEMI
MIILIENQNPSREKNSSTKVCVETAESLVPERRPEHVFRPRARAQFLFLVEVVLFVCVFASYLSTLNIISTRFRKYIFYFLLTKIHFLFPLIPFLFSILKYQIFHPKPIFFFF